MKAGGFIQLSFIGVLGLRIAMVPLGENLIPIHENSGLSCSTAI
jgi:hypothetical protein